MEARVKFTRSLCAWANYLETISRWFAQNRTAMRFCFFSKRQSCLFILII